MEKVFQIMDFYSDELLVAAALLLILLELAALHKINRWKKREKEQVLLFTETLKNISEKQELLAQEITQQPQEKQSNEKVCGHAEKEAPEKLLDAVLTEVFS